MRLGTGFVLGAHRRRGALLLLPASAFKAIVPVFIAIALVLVVLQPRINRRARRAPAAARTTSTESSPRSRSSRPASTAATSAPPRVVLLLGILGIALPQSLQRSNALKNVLAGLANGVAGLIFVFAADVAWVLVAIIAAGSIVGGQVGATYGRRLSPDALRGLIVVVGTAAIVKLLVE